MIRLSKKKKPNKANFKITLLTASPLSGAFLCEEIMRNDLLKEIVIAAGGSVTDESNRNQLLKDWLTALGG